MKKYLLTLFFFGLTVNGFSQSSSNKNIDFSDYESATLHFKDGESIKGIAKIVQSYKIKFKLSEKGKVSIWTNVMLKGITFHDVYQDKYLEYFYTDIDFPRLGYIVDDGFITLYSQLYTNYTVHPSSFNSGLIFPRTITEELKTDYYAKRKDQELAISLSGRSKSLNKRILGIDISFKGFKKVVKELMYDCDEVLKKVDSNEFNKNTIPEMIYYYNDFCADLD